MENTAVKIESTSSTKEVKNKSGNKKILVIVALLLLLCICCLVVSGIGYIVYQQGSSKLAEVDLENTLNNVINDAVRGEVLKENGIIKQNTGDTNGSFDISTDDVDIAINGNLPEGFPEYIKFYPTSSDHYSTVDNKTKSMSVMYSATGVGEDIFEFHKKGLVENGWKIEGEYSLFGYSLEGRKDNQDVALIVLGDDSTQDHLVTISIVNN